jgi:WhiB family transcriptional regulator, redox-sensing transcriptional regulator
VPDGRIEWLMQDFGGDLEAVPPGPVWQARAACLGTDTAVFFPEKGQPTGPALEVCAGCPVRDPCYRWAVAEGLDFGVFGGTTPNERKAARRDEAA